jgi:hypothetical protein
VRWEATGTAGEGDHGADGDGVLAGCSVEAEVAGCIATGVTCVGEQLAGDECGTKGDSDGPPGETHGTAVEAPAGADLDADEVGAGGADSRSQTDAAGFAVAGRGDGVVVT